MLDLKDKSKAVFMNVYPFEDLVATEDLGLAILKAASESRERYDRLAQFSIFCQENPEESDDEVLNDFITEYVWSSCELIQHTVNTIAAVFGSVEEAQKVITNGMFNLTMYCDEVGAYGEEPEGEETDDGEEEWDGTDGE